MKFLNSKIWIIIFAFVIGLIYYLPNFLMPNYLEPGDTACVLCNTDEAFAYASRLQDFVDGNWQEGDPFLFEYKNLPSIWGTNFMVVIVGGFMKLFHIKDIAYIFKYGDFVFPVFGFILIYYLFWNITHHKPYSYLAAFLLITFPNFFVYKYLFSLLAHGQLSLESISTLMQSGFNLYYSRLFIPAFSFIFFVGFLLSTYLSVTRKYYKKYIFSAAILFGSLFYVYFYYWVFATIALIFLFIFFFFVQMQSARQILKILFGGFLISIPYWIKFWILRQNPIYDDLALRTGIEYGRYINWNSIEFYIFAILAGIILYLLGKKLNQERTGTFLSALLLTSVAVLNVQLITGFNIQSDHWGSRVNIYISALGFLVLLFWLVKFLFQKKNLDIAKNKAFGALSFVAIFIFILFALFAQVNDTILNAKTGGLKKDVREAYEWINKNTEIDSVIVSLDTLINYQIPVFTHSNVYNPPACRSLASEAEITHRFLETYVMYGVRVEDFQKVLENDLKEITTSDIGDYLFCGKYVDLKTSERIPEKVKKTLIAEYGLLYKNISVGTLSFEADYLLINNKLQNVITRDFTKFSDLEEVFSNNLIKILKIVKN